MTIKSLAMSTKGHAGAAGPQAAWGEYLSAGLIALGILVALMI